MLMLKNHFKSENRNLLFSAQDINTIYRSYILDYYASLVFLKILRPSLLICSEQLGRGVLSAANSLNIRSIDLQHGIIDQFHAQYTFAKEMEEAKKHFAIPNFVGVFGAFHRDVLLRTGFWNDDEIVVLGSSRMNSNRLKYENKNSSHVTYSKSILVPTQYTIVDEALFLLSKLSPIRRLGFRIILKLHPLESESNIERYRKLVNLNEGFIEIKPKDSDIYSIIKQSKFVIGFDSTVLLESISLSVPAITIGTPSAPTGVHEFFSDTRLFQVIKKIDLSSIDELLEIIRKSVDDPGYYEKWISDTTEWSERLYANDYLGNCKNFISKNS
jgi:hypothetical protein